MLRKWWRCDLFDFVLIDWKKVYNDLYLWLVFWSGIGIVVIGVDILWYVLFVDVLFVCVVCEGIGWFWLCREGLNKVLGGRFCMREVCGDVYLLCSWWIERKSVVDG